MTTGLPTGPLAPPLDGRAAVPWITLHRRAPLSEAEILSKQVRPALLAGDVAERFDDIRLAFHETTLRFQKVFWTPGNHELWVSPSEGKGALRGEARYLALVDLARSFGVITPEDPYPLWTGPGGPCLIATLFLLYDYSFRPAHVHRDDVIPWAAEARSVCADETLLDFTPHASREAWCQQRCAITQARLETIDPSLPTILVNHFPLREDLIHIPRIPRFKPWCGTRATESWHIRFKAKAVVTGHLHTRRTDWRDGTRFEEVSLGYPRQWDTSRGLAYFLREILPGPCSAHSNKQLMTNHTASST